MDWVDAQEEKNAEARSKDYFNIEEGSQQFVLLSHCAPLAQVYDPSVKRYRPAEEGDSNVSIKGVCWVLQDGVIKQAKLPYTVVKAIRGIQQDPEWEFKLPFPHTLTLTAKNAGTKEVEYTLTPSPKTVEVSAEVMEEYRKKLTPEEMVDKIRNKGTESTQVETHAPVPYPEEEINPDDIPFN